MRIPQAGFYPFWFWNGVQNEAEIVRQLDEIVDSGCKGYALHSRAGNQIPYLSPRWLDLVEFACEESCKRNLKVWLYDEDGFPSGNAGMRVQQERPDLLQKSLRFSVVPSDPENNAFASFSQDGSSLVNEKDLTSGTPVLRAEICNNVRHVDTLDPDTAKTFLKLNHELYAERVGRFFGNTIEAVYTDDVSFLVWYEKAWVWSGVLEKALGDDCRANLGKLFFDLPGSGEFREKYYRTAQELFINNFILPQRKWCHDHDLAYLGHLCGDEGPRVRTVKNYASPEPFYLAEDVPSVDDYLLDMKDLGYLKRPYTGDEFRLNPCGLERCYPLYTYLTASSVANRSGVNQVSSETWAFLGWNMPIDFIEPQTFFEIAMGQTLLTPHAFYYTLEGRAEQDCPPSYFIQQPYWQMFKKRLPVWSRFAERTASARRTAETVLIVPEELLHLQNSQTISGSLGELAQADRALQELILQMMRLHIDFDLIEENQLLKTKQSGEVLIAGKMQYKNVVYCAEIPLQKATFDHISKMNVFDETNVDALPRLWNLPEELLVVKREEETGNSLWILQNLSGESMPLAGKFPQKALTVIDAATETAVFRGDGFPADFVLPHGKTLMLTNNWNGKEIAFADSVFAPLGNKIPLTVTSQPAEKLGDLAQQGFVGKAEIFVYQAEFEGTAKIAELKMTNGVAEVELNGNPLGICWGSDMLSLADHTCEGKNKLTIRFANTAGNLYGKKDAPFGIDSIAVFC